LSLSGPVDDKPSNRELLEEIKPETALQSIIRHLLSDNISRTGGIIILVFVILAIFANYLAPYDPYFQDLASRLTPPTASHLLGQDQLGRDVLSRIIYGTRISLEVGTTVVAISLTVGTIMGAVSGFFGGKTDQIIMRIADVLLAFPGLILAIGLMAVLGQGIFNVIVSLSIVTWPGYARVIRSQALSLKELEYVEAARLMNASNFRLIFKHIIPNSISPIIILGTIGIGFAILAEAGLSFLGLGVGPNIPSWGSIIADGRANFILDPYLMIFPGIFLALGVLSFNLIGDSLRDALDPSLRF
jgi:ABC-type dipeptide/oligopeptide/nickel transport system permease subunit